MASDARADMVVSAASLIASRGLTATSFTEVLGDSGAPRGSIYHHFPNGKDQLAYEALELVAERLLAHVRDGASETPEQVLSNFIDIWRRVVVASNGSSGCAVAGVAVDTTENSIVMDHVRDIFRRWTDEVARQLERSGMSTTRSSSVARTALAAMEGALILCRAEGSVEPLNDVGTQLLRLA